MPLSWNEIRNRAHEFSKRWEDETSEDAEAKPFWTEFFGVFGIDRKRVASFEEPVKKLGDKQGYIDLFWKGVLLVEHKSRGKNLDKAYTQALDYFPGIKERDLPKYVLVSDFERFRLYDLELPSPQPSPSLRSPRTRGEGAETSPLPPARGSLRSSGVPTGAPLAGEAGEGGRRPGEGAFYEFKLCDLHKHIKHFAFIAGYRTQTIAPQNPVNIKAAERMGRLHDALKAAGYEGHPLEVLLVRLLFCLFAEDTGIFQPASAFRMWVEERTAADGSDLGSQLAQLFQVLNTPESPPPQSSPASGRGDERENQSSIPSRSKNLDEQLAAFPYVNGKLFEEMLPIASFNLAMREALLDCCALDWSAISPAIFGALFQSIMDAKARRNIGAHYTSEENILKLIQPLFLDDLHEEFKRVKGNKNKLFEFHKKLRTLTFFDPACGCGNFLVIAYRELRKLELDVLRAVHEGPGSRFLDIHQQISVDVDQFFGIEIEEFPAQIAQVALWLMDHQMNVRVSEEFGMYFARIPLKTSPHIVNGNALTLDWNDVLPAEKASYVFGNPPFVGAKFMDDTQREETRQVFAGIEGGGLLDLVAAWYVKAARYITAVAPAQAGVKVVIPAKAGIQQKENALSLTALDSRFRGNDKTRCAFVSTNSITQGEQVGVLWSWLLAQGIRIHFAHRTFQWSNEAKGMAAVHCIIIGFYLPSPASGTLSPLAGRGQGEGREGEPQKTIYEYEDIRGEPHAIAVRNINPYLVDAPDVVLVNRQHPICAVPEIGIGNKPIDGGNYLFTTEERDEFLKREPGAEKWFRRWIGADEFLNGYERWCLWLGDCPPDELRRMPEAMKRVEAVREFRLASKSAPTQKLAATPTRFHVENIPDSSYLVIPEVSSERRMFIPIGFEQPDTLSSNLVKIVPHATLYHFGILTSTMHMAWVRYTCGRLKSDYRYSAGIVYNNFPWPDAPFTPNPLPLAGEGGAQRRERGKWKPPPKPCWMPAPILCSPRPLAGRAKRGGRSRLGVRARRWPTSTTR